MGNPKSSTSLTSGRRRRDIWLLRAVALIITLLLWVTVLGGKKIEITKKVNLDFQIPANFVISNQVPSEVTFRVTGPRAFLKEFQERSITIPINLKNSQEGDYEVVIQEDMLEIPLGLRVTAISQSSMTVKLDKLTTKRVPVRAVFREDLSEVKIRSVTVQPSTVEILGPRNRLKNIEAVPTESISMGLDNLQEAIVAKITTNDFPGVRLAEEGQVVEVSVETDGTPPRRLLKDISVKVKMNRNGQLLPIPLEPRGIKIRPRTVNIYVEGAKSRIDNLSAQDIEVWAELKALKAGVYRSRLVWTLPPDVRVVRRSSDWVEIVVPVEGVE